MLNNSFSHIPSVGVTTERRIWSSGVRTMDDFLESPPEFLSLNKRKEIVDHIHLSKEKISSKDVRYFYDNLPSRESVGEFSKNIKMQQPTLILKQQG